MSNVFADAFFCFTVVNAGDAHPRSVEIAAPFDDFYRVEGPADLIGRRVVELMPAGCA